MDKTITYIEFERLLEFFHLSRLTQRAKQLIFFTFQRRGFTKEEVFAIINGANKKEILSTPDKRYVRLNLLKLTEENFTIRDIELYKRLNEIDQIFKKYFRDNGLKQKDYTDGLRECWALARRINKTVNDNAIKFTSKELETLEILARLYKSVAEHVESKPITAVVREKDPLTGEFKRTEAHRYATVEKEFVRVADYIVSTRLAELNNSTLSKITNETVKEFNEFLDAITSTAEDNVLDTFSKEEVKDLLDKTISLIGLTNASKYTAVRDSLNAYIKGVQVEFAGQYQTANFEELSNMTAKNVILKAGSILTRAEDSISFTLDFVMGKTISENKEMEQVNPATASVQSKRVLLKKYFPNLKLQNMDLEAHLYLLKQTPSHLTNITPSTIYELTTQIMDSVLLGYGENIEKLSIEEKKLALRSKGFNINTIYSKDNFFEIFSTGFIKGLKNSKQTIIENIKTLSSYIKCSDVHKIISHNINLLLMDNEKLTSTIEEFKHQANGINEKFAKLFHNFINAKYTQTNTTKEIEEENNATSSVKRAKTTKVEESMPTPEKEEIFVNVIGVETIEEEEEPEIPEDVETPITYSDVYLSVCIELEELIKYANCQVKSDLEELSKTIEPNSVAGKVTRARFVEKPNISNFKKLLKVLTEKIAQLSSFEEFSNSDKLYIQNLLEQLQSLLEERKDCLEIELSDTDEKIKALTKKEKDKESRSHIEQLRQAIAQTKGLQSLNLVAKRYRTLVNSDVTDWMQRDLDSELTAAEEIRNNRKPEVRALPKAINEAISIRTENNFVKLILSATETWAESLSVSNQDEVVVEVKDDVTLPDVTEAEIRERIEFLTQQRDLKLKKLKAKFGNRFKYNDIPEDKLEEYLNHPFAKDIIAIIRKIEQEIKELEEILKNIINPPID